MALMYCKIRTWVQTSKHKPFCLNLKAPHYLTARALGDSTRYPALLQLFKFNPSCDLNLV